MSCKLIGQHPIINATDAVFDSSFTTCRIFGTFAFKCQIKLFVIGIEMVIRLVVHGETGARLAQFSFEVRISFIRNFHLVEYESRFMQIDYSTIKLYQSVHCF